MLFRVASKYVTIRASDNSYSWSFAITARVKVGGCPAITRGAIYQGVGVGGVFKRSFQPFGQCLPLLRGQNARIFKGTGLQLIDNSLDLIELSFS